MPPLAPMLAKAAAELPEAEPGAWWFEPKWDGFRCLVFRDGDEVVLGSRNDKPLTRYFPELLDPLRASLPDRCVVDGEVVVAGPEGLDFDALQQRIHPAESRVNRLAAETPASFVGFDLVALDRATEYAGEDSDITLRLHQSMIGHVEGDEKLNHIYRAIELPTAEVLQKIERNGVLINAEFLGGLSQEFGARIVELEQQAYELAEGPFSDAAIAGIKATRKALAEMQAEMPTILPAVTALTAAMASFAAVKVAERAADWVKGLDSTYEATLRQKVAAEQAAAALVAKTRIEMEDAVATAARAKAASIASRAAASGALPARVGGPSAGRSAAST